MPVKADTQMATKSSAATGIVSVNHRAASLSSRTTIAMSAPERTHRKVSATSHEMKRGV